MRVVPFVFPLLINSTQPDLEEFVPVEQISQSELVEITPLPLHIKLRRDAVAPLKKGGVPLPETKPQEAVILEQKAAPSLSLVRSGDSIFPAQSTPPQKNHQPSAISNQPPNPYQNLFQAYSDQYQVDLKLLTHIAHCESRFNPAAINGQHLGLFQFSPSTWSSTRETLGQNPDPTLRTNPEEAIKTAAFKIAAGGQRAWAACLPK